MADMGDTYEKLGIIGTLVALGGAAIRFLLNERKEMVKHIRDNQQCERDFRDSRTAELLQTAELLAQSSEVVRDALAEHTQAIENLERKVDECSKNGPKQ